MHLKPSVYPSFLGRKQNHLTMNITSFYTVIPNNEGLQALKYLLNQRLVKNPSSETLLRLVELVFTHAFHLAIKKINGVEIGTKIGPTQLRQPFRSLYRK